VTEGRIAYRTEVVIPTDRVLVLHLPDDMPLGQAVVTVRVEEPATAPVPQPLTETLDLDNQDMEWWDVPEGQ
jgi:hypothetical protein